MTRLIITFLATALASSMALAQNPPSQPAMGGRMGQQQNMAAMHEQMMQNMQANLDSMQATLKKMKEQLSRVSDQPTKEQMQLNINMWQSFIDNTNKQLAMMKQMGPGRGPMMRGQQPPPAKPQTSPQ